MGFGPKRLAEAVGERGGGLNPYLAIEAKAELHAEVTDVGVAVLDQEHGRASQCRRVGIGRLGLPEEQLGDHASSANG